MTKILIIEDEVMIAEDLAETCRNFGYEVIEPAYSAGEGLNKLQDEKVDLVLLDINLSSEVNGIEIAEYINENIKIPFIFITSYSDRNTLKAAKDTKPIGYITKPFKRADIFTTIEISLQNYKLLQTKDFPSLDLLNSKLTSTLTPREYDLLEEIYNGKSNQELAEAFNISLNTVKSHLKNCYIKLGAKSRIDAISRIREF